MSFGRLPILTTDKTMKNIKWIILAVVAYSLNSCYTFKTAGIPAGMETFYIPEVENTAANVVGTLASNFQLKLTDKIRIEGKLTPTEYEPHVQFEATITGFRVSSVAPEEGQTTAFNRLDISVRVKFTKYFDLNFADNKYYNPNPSEDQKDGKVWTQTFSFFEDYPSDENLLDLQDDLIENITDQIVEDIFNKAFSDW